MTLLIAGLILFTLIVFYIAEKREIKRKRANIKTVIAVTGTRGKSTTVRFLTVLFQKSGYRTLGKITGTKASLILPNGSFQKINRKGVTSIIEQKKVLLKKADQLRPEILITEIMSVTPEYQKMETQNILNPNYLVITNIKEDHIGVSGNSKEEIADMFVRSTPEDTTCITLESEKGSFKNQRAQITFIQDNKKLRQIKEIQPGFYETLLIADYFVKAFDIDQDTFMRCIEEFESDNEVFYIKKRDENTLYVNAFSANDPESTLSIIDDLKRNFPEHSVRGIFCTRDDKPNRTSQWISTFKDLKKDTFEAVHVFGTHYNIIRRHRYSFPLLKLKKEQFESVFSPQGKKVIFVGFGNYINSGEIILKHWDEVCE